MLYTVPFATARKGSKHRSRQMRKYMYSIRCHINGNVLLSYFTIISNIAYVKMVNKRVLIVLANNSADETVKQREWDAETVILFKLQRQ